MPVDQKHPKRRSCGLAMAFGLMILALVQVAPVQAHRFDVAVILALGGPGAAEGEKFVQGFMLATRERDAHANEESDGHLGGLDVYVSLIDRKGDLMELLGQSLQNSDIQIAVFARALDVGRVISLLETSGIVQLVPSEVDFAVRDPDGYSAFVAAFIAFYGEEPTNDAAQGYDAARRIDLAVREQGSANNSKALIESFMGSSSGINWLR